MKLQTRLLLAMGGLFLIAVAGVQLLDYRQVQRDIAEELLEDARHIRALLMTTRQVYQQQLLDSGLPLSGQTLHVLPAHALARISERLRNWTEDGLNFHNVSDRPRNPDNAADALEKEAIGYFREHRESTERLTPFTAAGGERFFLYTAPIWVEPHCLTCHGRQADAPPTVRSRYQTAYDYQIGDLRRVLSIRLPVAAQQARLLRRMEEETTGHLAILGIAFLSLSWLLRRTVLGRLRRLKAATVEVAQGCYRAGVAPAGGDEFAEVAAAFDAMARTLAERERTLRESEGKLRAVLQAIPDHMSILDESLNIIWANKASREIFGADIVGTKCYAVRHGREKPCEPNPCFVLQTFQDGTPHVHPEKVAIDADGNRRFLHCHAAVALRDSCGRPTAVLETSRDITTQKKAEAEVHRYRQHLEELVGERTRDLEAARVAAEAASAAKSRFLAIMSYELRTPLNAILGFSEFMLPDAQNPLAKRQEECLRHIQEGATSSFP